MHVLLCLSSFISILRSERRLMQTALSSTTMLVASPALSLKNLHVAFAQRGETFVLESQRSRDKHRFLNELNYLFVLFTQRKRAQTSVRLTKHEAQK